MARLSGREGGRLQGLPAVRWRGSARAQPGSSRTTMATWPVRFGPARIPSRESPEAAVEALLERGYDACEIDFECGFWMDYPWAERLGELAREHDIALSVHAPLFGFMGHLEASGRKFASAVGALDRSAGIAAACGAEVVVFHPGFLLGRSREDALDAVVEQLGDAARAAGGQGPRGAVRGRGDGPRARPRLRSTTSSRSPRAPAGSDPCSISRTCTRRATARTSSVEPFAEALAAASTTSSSPARRSTSTSRTSRTPTATRRSTSPTARGRSAPSRWREALGRLRAAAR